ncbi:Conjugal transfer protein [Psychrobacter sp. JB385]|nr:Conjugal transfer protein [Psychrobacter sp. JB385]
MAIYHLSTKPVSRSSGRTATASIAYRAGIAIKDERTGKEHDYTKRSGVVST